MILDFVSRQSHSERGSDSSRTIASTVGSSTTTISHDWTLLRGTAYRSRAMIPAHWAFNPFLFHLPYSYPLGRWSARSTNIASSSLVTVWSSLANGYPGLRAQLVSARRSRASAHPGSTHPPHYVPSAGRLVNNGALPMLAGGRSRAAGSRFASRVPPQVKLIFAVLVVAADVSASAAPSASE